MPLRESHVARRQQDEYIGKTFSSFSCPWKSKCRYHTRPFGADVLLLMDNMRPVNRFLNEDWSTT